ncbi:hypothetical protein PoB_007617500 [Plakobranchus ocellatus]|uniref:Secreted protein n=1 Tax=Plakobranchus ocellatus TaxID=259542 RepID=A0AAV4E095_9GAST|nr:hypothetical protein PoB_007617500 [Plakobranchus ocellatus]
MFWGAISVNLRTACIIVQGSLTARRYINEVLAPQRPRRSSTTHLSVRQVHADTQTCTASQSCTRGRLLDDRVRATMSSRRTHRLLRPTGSVLSKTTIGIGRHDQTGSVFNHGHQ